MALALLLIATVLTVFALKATGANQPTSSLGSRNGGSHSGQTGHGTAPSSPVLKSLVGSYRFPGSLTLPFPKTGESAVYIPGLGVLGTSKKQKPLPIASETKVMTALIVLRDHPLTPGEGGPVFTMTEQDHLAWIYASENDHSNVMIKAGEHIDELQLLEALLIPSADNAADYLAKWDSGSLQAFVVKMNAEAQQLGLHQTHYVDPSGVDPKDVSTPVDQAVLGAVAMTNPVIASIVSHQYLTVPVAGKVWNYNPAVGIDGVVGVKSGFTQAAQACLVTAAWRTVGGHRLLVVSSTLDQPLGLQQAAQVDLALLEAASSRLEVHKIVRAGAVVGTAEAQWGSKGSSPLLAGSDLTAVGWPGLVITPSLVGLRSGERFSAGSEVAALEVAAGSSQIAVPLTLANNLPQPPGSSSP